MLKGIKIILIIIMILVLLSILGIMIYRLIYNHKSSNEKLVDLDNEFIKKSNNRETILLVESKDGSRSHFVSNKMTNNDKFYLASISKLYTHAVIFKLLDENVIDLKKSISSYLPDDLINELLVNDEKDFSQDITVQNLLDQTSGFADYETDLKGEASIVLRLQKEDFRISPYEAITLTKKLPAKSLPNQNKAYYSNINAILLGLIAENQTGETLERLYQKYIFNPLELKNTTVLKSSEKVIHPYIKDMQTKRTLYVSSAVAAGGIISDTKDLMIFIRAFYGGRLFDKHHIENPKFRSIQFFPLKYGSGMMSVEINILMSPLFDAPQILGHSGMTGSFAFYCPSKDLFIVGSLNQFEANPFQLIYKYIDAIR